MDKKDKLTASLAKNLPTIKQDRPVQIDKDIKDNIPNHLKGLSKQQIKSLKKLYK